MRLLVAVGLLAACSSPAKPGPTRVERTTSEGTCENIAWSCVGTLPDGSTPWGCIEGNASQTVQYQATCTPEKAGLFALGACPRDDVIAGCTVARGSQCTTTWYLAPATRASIEDDCAKQGAKLVAP
ncbi:MAG: hypothetical protein H0T89_28490 [Deltaproteobacteria bacterium]|nr:hypothetical protein [Deltaproteobacteria bacterium]MDQ3301557.1 hypothetical protein [Myxococcota bacterium]